MIDNRYDRQILREFLDLETITTVPLLSNPYGSFTKATYELYPRFKPNVPAYRFTTTSKNTEECLGIMKEKYISIYRRFNHFSVYKIQDGKRERIYSSNPEHDKS